MEQPKEKKKRFNSKGKGNGFEGAIAKKLTTALQPLNFIRTPGSGARVGGKNFQTIGQMFGEDALKIFVGDVVPVNERQVQKNFVFSIECKSYATADNFTSLASGTANIYKWFEEAVVDAAKLNKKPLLVFKWNRTPIFAAVEDTAEHTQWLASKSHISVDLLLKPAGGRKLLVFELDKLLAEKDFFIC